MGPRLDPARPLTTSTLRRRKQRACPWKRIRRPSRRSSRPSDRQHRGRRKSSFAQDLIEVPAAAIRKRRANRFKDRPVKRFSGVSFSVIFGFPHEIQRYDRPAKRFGQNLWRLLKPFLPISQANRRGRHAQPAYRLPAAKPTHGLRSRLSCPGMASSAHPRTRGNWPAAPPPKKLPGGTGLIRRADRRRWSGRQSTFRHVHRAAAARQQHAGSFARVDGRSVGFCATTSPRRRRVFPLPIHRCQT